MTMLAEPAVTAPAQKPKSALRLWLGRTMSRFGSWLTHNIGWTFWIKRLLLLRIIPIMTGVFLTYNVWGWSYVSWAQSWLEYLYAPFLTIPRDTWLQFGWFCAVCAAVVFGYWLFFYGIHSRCKGFGQRFWWQILPIIVLSFIVGNPWYGAWSWLPYWKEQFFPVWPWVLTASQLTDLKWFAAASAVALGLWSYVLTKAWQGVGSRKIAAFIVLFTAAAFVWIISTAKWFPTGVSAGVTIIEAALAFLLGVVFSFTLMDRLVSGTIAATTRVQESEDSGHGHAADAGEAEHDSVVAAEDEANATHH